MNDGFGVFFSEVVERILVHLAKDPRSSPWMTKIDNESLRKYCWQQLGPGFKASVPRNFEVEGKIFIIKCEAHVTGLLCIHYVTRCDQGSISFYPPLTSDVMDYLDALEEENPKRFANLSSIPFRHIVEQSDSWHRKLVTTKRKPAGDEGTDHRVESDNHYWVRLATIEAMDREGKTMGHCVGRGSYDRYAEWAANEGGIWSLRNNKGMSVATAEYVLDDEDVYRLMQTRGINNGVPNMPEKDLRRHQSRLHVYFFNRFDIDKIVGKGFAEVQED